MDPLEIRPEERVDALWMLALALISSGPLLMHLVFGGGSLFEMGLGTALATLSIAGFVRTLRPARGEPRDDDEG